MAILSIPQNTETAGIAILIICSAFFIKTLYTAFFNPLSKIPGPWYARFTNLVLKYHVITGNRIHYVHSLHHAYGPIVLISPDQIACSSLSSFQTIHPVSKTFLKAQWYQDFLPKPEGIFTMIDPKVHAVRRKTFANAFSKSFLKTNWEDEIRRKVTLAVEKIKRDALKKEADILTFFTFLATDVIAHLSFGESFKTLENEQKTQFVKDLQFALHVDSIRAEFPILFAIGEFLHISPHQESDKRIFEYGAIAVRNAKSQNDAQPTFFRKALSESKTENTEGSMTDLDIRHEAAHFLVAGTDTTAVSLTYLVYNVLKDQNLQKQLEDEVDTLREDFETKDVEGLVLLNATIDEGLRLYGAAPGGLPRTVPKEGTLLDGYQIPGGVTVSTQSYTIHRDPEIYSEPESFKPQRWLDHKTTNMKAAYHPYGAGTRACAGIHLARMELLLTLALFFRECKGARIALSQAEEDMALKNYFVVEPKGKKCMITMRDGY